MDNRRLGVAYEPGGASPAPFGLDCAAGDVSIDRGKMTATGIFATDDRDRVGDILNIAGIDTTNHRLLPIALWDHGKNPNIAFPIGRHKDDDGNYLVQLDPDSGIAIATTRFSQSLPEAEQIFALIDEKIVGAQSIGYRELKTRPIVEQGRKAGKFLDAVELVEITWCAAPVNAGAVGGYAELVRKALSRDRICGKSLLPALRRSLEPLAERPSIWSPGWTPTHPVPWVPASFGKSLSAVATKAFDESKVNRDHGKFASAARQWKESSPFPQGLPSEPPGMARSGPGFDDNPEIQAARKRRDEWSPKQLRARVAHTVHDILNDKANFKPVPLPNDDAELRVKVGRAKREIEQVQGIRGQLGSLDVWGGHQAVLASHPEAALMIDAAAKSGREQLAAAIENASEHIAGLPEEMQPRAQRQFEQAQKSLSALDQSAGGALVGEKPKVETEEAKPQHPPTIWERFKDLPSYFRRTHYALPTPEQIEEFDKYPALTPDDIGQGVGYTIVGRGMRGQSQQQQIVQAIRMLVDRYPDRAVYQDALAAAESEKPWTPAEKPADAPLETKAAESGDGRWVTVGGKEGEDGEHHAGTHLFVKDGKVEKGPASLTGEKVDDLKKADDEHGREHSTQAAKEAMPEGTQHRPDHSIWSKRGGRSGDAAKTQSATLSKLRKAGFTDAGEGRLEHPHGHVATYSSHKGPDSTHDSHEVKVQFSPIAEPKKNPADEQPKQSPNPWKINWGPATPEEIRGHNERMNRLIAERRKQAKSLFGGKSAIWEESKHPRGQGGKFGSGGGRTATATAEPPSAPSSSSAGQSARRTAIASLVAAGKKAGAVAGHLEHAVGEKTKAAVSTLPTPLQWACHGVWHFFTGTYTVAQHAVAAVAKERGLSDEQAGRISAICCSVNLVCAKALPFALEHHGAGVGEAFGAGMVPVGSLCYLAFSTAKNPLATFRAAKKGVQAVLAKIPTGKSQSPEEDLDELAHAFADRAEALGDGMDGWFAAFMAAMEETGGDLPEAMRAADQVTTSNDDGIRTKSLSFLIGKADDWDESKHPRATNGQFGNGTVTTNSHGLRVRRDAEGNPVKVHDTPKDTKHTEEEHFDTEKRPGFLRVPENAKYGRPGAMSDIQVPKEEKDKYDLETPQGLVFRSAMSIGAQEAVHKQYQAYHQHLADQLEDHVTGTLEGVRDGSTTPAEAKEMIAGICDEFEEHLEHSKDELANWMQTFVNNHDADKGPGKADEIKAAVDKAFENPSEYRGMLDASLRIRQVFEEIDDDMSDEADVDEILDEHESDLDEAIGYLSDAAANTSEDIDEAKTKITDDLDTEHDEERQRFQDEAEGMVGDLDELEPEDAAEQAEAFNRRADESNHPQVHLYYDEESGWEVIDDDNEEFEPDDVGVDRGEPEPEKSLALAGV